MDRNVPGMKRVILGAMVPLMFLCSCTVLEDRSDCPNYLTVDMQRVDKSIKEWQMWLFDGDGKLLYKDTIYRRSYSAPYVVEVPRSPLVRCLFWGNIRSGSQLDEMYSYGTRFNKLENVSADSLYFYTDTISTVGEESYLKVEPSKEFATVDIYLKGWIGSDFEADMVLECANSGFYVGKEFIGGKSRTTVQVYDIGNNFTHFRSRILRQQDPENIILRLSIKEFGTDDSTARKIINKEIPIGEYLWRSGYDMQQSSLEDITIEVDYSYDKIRLKTSDWEAIYIMNEEF